MQNPCRQGTGRRDGLAETGRSRAVRASASLLAAGWLAAAPTAPSAAPLPVLATTSFAGEVVRAVGGDAVSVSVWLPPDADPHAFQPRPADLARVEKAALVFVSGLGLERSLEPILLQPGVSNKIVDLSAGLEGRRLSGGHHGHDKPEAGHVHGPGCAHGEVDPHAWTDPRNLRSWAAVVARVLSGRLPERRADFERNAAAYASRLDDLDRWIENEVKSLPPERRILLTDHEELGYFADRYGFRTAGTILPGASTLAQPSARDLAALQDQIRRLKIPALFVGAAVNPRLADQLARDTGAKVVRLYIHGFSRADGPAPDYESLMRHNVKAIVEALR